MNRHPSSTLPFARTLRPSWAVLAIASLAASCGGGGSDASADAASNAQATEVAALPDAVAADAESGGKVTEASALAARKRPPPSPQPIPAPAPERVVSPAAISSGSTCGLLNFQASVLARINQYRAAGASCRTGGQFAPAPPLVWNNLLLQAASGHSLDMASKNYFSHTSQDGRTMVDRVNATGYLWSALGENIAAGYPSVNAVVDGWMASDGHCANLMKAAFKDIGMACVSSSTSTYRTYWTMDVGKRR